MRVVGKSSTSIVKTFAVVVGNLKKADGTTAFSTTEAGSYQTEIEKDTEIKGAKGIAFCLLNFPQDDQIKSVIKALKNGLNPRTTRDFVRGLPEGDFQLLKLGFGVLNKDSTEEDLIEELNKAPEWKKYVKEVLNKSDPLDKWEAAPIEVNIVKGANLLLTQPLAIDIVMERRQKAALLQQAMRTRLVAPIGIVAGPWPGMTGGANLNPEYPIEMRGAGQVISSMRAGWFPYAIGTLATPTQWQPVSDVVFLSAQLNNSYKELTKLLMNQKTPVVLDPTTDKEVQDLITKLKDAELEVKKRRDTLSKYNEMISTGNAADLDELGGKNIGKVEDRIKKIDDAVETYNRVQQKRHKTEMKIFRVISALSMRLA
jgi:hypothetical protein